MTSAVFRTIGDRTTLRILVTRRVADLTLYSPPTPPLLPPFSWGSNGAFGHACSPSWKEVYNISPLCWFLAPVAVSLYSTDAFLSELFADVSGPMLCSYAS